jgi:hypothetical protein
VSTTNTAQPHGAESERLAEAHRGSAPWKAWGPYLSERQWGTVREDYSDDGNAWDYFSHDQARSRAYHWGEDGLAGISDEHQRLCLSLALWNEKDPILKERMFGLTNSEANHGEDVKEYWFYVDSTPTHSYMKLNYKYPQAEFPYNELIRENSSRGKLDFEYELMDTHIFDDDRYFDVDVEYAKAGPDDILMQVTAHNRGPDAAPLHLLPTLWFRNTWSWGREVPRPSLKAAALPGGEGVLAHHDTLGDWGFQASSDADLLFCENETNNARLFNGTNATPYVKDGINDHVVNGTDAVNPEKTGTKAAAHYSVTIPAGQSATVRVRLTHIADKNAPSETAENALGKDFDTVLGKRHQEADEFYAGVIPAQLPDDEKLVMRQALAGLLWGKQYFEYDVAHWLHEHGVNPWSPSAASSGERNATWAHMNAGDIISMPDKWEYPWFAAWDLAFHCAPLALVDIDFAKEQIELLLSARYLHPNGQIPAYEWNFSDVNPPVTAWAALWVYRREVTQGGKPDYDFLARVFPRLLTNFTWWVNRKDANNNNLFQGGFLGLDNIGIFDRSAPLPGGGTLEQADGTAWMALYCQWMLQISLELSKVDPLYDEMAAKFIEHFALIEVAVNPPDGEETLWDDEDGFFYDIIRLPDGSTVPMKVRSLVGLLPLCAATVFNPAMIKAHPELVTRIAEARTRLTDLDPELAKVPAPSANGTRLLSLVDAGRLRRILKVMLDEKEFLGDYGIRSLSRAHLDDPVNFEWGGQNYRVQYVPAESDTGMFGGNSNWRGPVWFPMNAVIIRALSQLYLHYGDGFTVECPTGSGHQMNLKEVALEIGHRLIKTFLREEDGRRPVYGGVEKFQKDPNWKDLVLFFEYFHGDNGAGIGASHQTGWTGLVALMCELEAELGAQALKPEA